MSEQVEGSRANQAVTALAAFLEDELGFPVARHWAHPDRKGKAVRPVGAVTYLRSDFTLEGLEEFEEPNVGDGAVITKMGIEELSLQVDIWERSLDDRFITQGKVERLFETGENSQEGALILDSPPSVIRYTRTGMQFTDTALRAGNRDWRMTLELNAVADILVTEYFPLMDIVVRLRREGFVDPPPPPNTLGETLTQQDFTPEG